MALSRRTGRSRLTLALLVITSIALLTLDFRDAGPVESARRAASSVFSPLRGAAETVTGPFTDAWHGVTGYGDLEAENERLRARIDEMEGRSILEEELHAEIRGRDLVTGLPKTIVTTTEEIRQAMEEPVAAITDAVKVTLDKTPPELAADIMEKGITLAGGGALLHGLQARLHHETGMPIVIAADPLHAVAMGSGQSLEEFEALKGVLFSSTNH